MSRPYLLAVAILAACGDGSSSGGDQLSCSFFEKASCWSQALDQLELCVPDRRMRGLFEPGGTLCIYPGSERVEFQRAAPDPITASGWQFRLVDGMGRTCAVYEDGTEAGISYRQLITYGGSLSGIVRIDQSREEVAVTCPDGSRLSTTEVRSVASCLPWRRVTEPAEGVIAFALGISADGEADTDVKMFECGAITD